MIVVRIVFSSALLIAAPLAATEQVTQGLANAVDGDSLDFSGTKIHLFGIDAPENSQTCSDAGADWKCGEEAKKLLDELTQGHRVKCRALQFGSNGEAIATCSRDGLDLGLAMIEAGLAVTVKDSPATYVEAEALRKKHKMGLWASEFQSPADWRTANIQTTEPTATAPSPATRPQNPPVEQIYRNKFGCAIKGNRNRRGQWIYHLPGRPYYDQTRPEELFCTESEAQRAGYRRSKA
ncbi:thermonuclease family protein [Pontixanthobacter aestiaquae]|uniref:TNase-like domain-containing protein n=1 Tax=Pontixanthobacter aestiaquae TaxID=1509367 RepID=A0A844Z5I6_9SPHN|nr:thermonuclease family protein [Pontixanthobacter aestiaquae]MDN3646418.1 thermonuclease family protein [Pontixanthobacter aestiaquae]MXO82592.1 hypothetical protein [Pontixanthobacter aestiaquae]